MNLTSCTKTYMKKVNHRAPKGNRKSVRDRAGGRDFLGCGSNNHKNYNQKLWVTEINSKKMNRQKIWVKTPTKHLPERTRVQDTERRPAAQ